jgi:DNA-binding MarR family transcriptional regulator
MFEPLDKLLNNPIRLIIMSVLMQVDNSDFTYLKEVTNSTQGNLSIQIKKLSDAGYILVSKGFENNYPKTNCKVTIRGKAAFEAYFNAINSYKNNPIK